MKNIINLLLTLSIATGLAAQSGWKDIQKENYKMSYPASYSLDESGSMGTKFILFSAAEPGKAEDFRENVNLIVQEVGPSEMDLQAIIQSTESSIEKLLSNSKIISSQVKYNHNGEYYELVYTGDMGKLQLQWMQCLYYKNGKLHIVTFTAEANTIANFEEEARKILGTFKIL